MMELIIEEQKENKLLNRTEIHFTVNFDGPTPSRKEVKKDMHNDQQSQQIKGSGRTYFLDVEKTRKGQPYLRITESRKKEGEKFERHSIHVFPEDAGEFAQAVSEMTSKLGEEKPA